jgi:hypothetical protein
VRILDGIQKNHWLDLNLSVTARAFPAKQI